MEWICCKFQIKCRQYFNSKLFRFNFTNYCLGRDKFSLLFMAVLVRAGVWTINATKILASQWFSLHLKRNKMNWACFYFSVMGVSCRGQRGLAPWISKSVFMQILISLLWFFGTIWGSLPLLILESPKFIYPPPLEKIPADPLDQGACAKPHGPIYFVTNNLILNADGIVKKHFIGFNVDWWMVDWWMV